MGEPCHRAGGCAAAWACDRVQDLCGGSGEQFFPVAGTDYAAGAARGAGDSRRLRGVRGVEVPLDYDPMLSKLVAFAATREMAIDRMLRALEEYVIGGIKTNIGLFRRILTDEGFRAARIDTGYLERLLAAAAPRRSGAVLRTWWRWRRRCLRGLRSGEAAPVCCGGEPVGRGRAAGGIAASDGLARDGGKETTR